MRGGAVLRARGQAWWCAALLAVGCAQAKTIEPLDESTARVAMPMPERVLVFEFAVNAGEVGLNRGAAAELSRAGDSAQQVTASEDAAGHAAARELADDIVKRLGELGIAAVRVEPSTPLLGPALAVDGHFLTVDEGDRARRVLIGLGAGATHVRAAVEIDSLTEGDFEALRRFETEAESRREGVDESIHRTARQIVREVARFYAQQGWLDPARVPQ